LEYPADGGSKITRNGGIYKQIHTASYPRIFRSALVFCASQTSQSSSLLFCNSGRHWRRVNPIKWSLECRIGSQSSAVSTGTMPEAGRFGVRIAVVKSFFFSSPKRPDRLCRPPNLLFHGNWGFFHAVKQTGRPPSAKVKNEWKYSLPIFPLDAFIAWTGKSLHLPAIQNVIKYLSKSFFLSYFMYKV
jgi:hypothetical protein